MTQPPVTLSPSLEARLAALDPDPSVPLPPDPSLDDEFYDRHLARGLRLIPARYSDALLDSCDPAVQAWADELVAGVTDQGLLLSGPTGTGKTYTAYAALRYLIAAGVRHVECYTEPQLFGRLRSDRDNAERHLADIEECELLMLDDLGSAKASEWTEELLYRVVDSRYQAKRPVLFATNATPQSLHTMLGARVSSRLAEMVRTVPIVGADRRTAQ